MTAVAGERARTAARRRRLPVSGWRLAVLAVVASVAVAALVVGVGLRGSGDRVASGVTIAGVDVSGLSAAEAVRELEERAAARASQPSIFVARGHSAEISPASAELEIDWRGAVERALAAGEGFGPFRGFKRLKLRFSGVDVTPTVDAYTQVIDYELAELAKEFETKAREGALELRGLDVEIVPGSPGVTLDRRVARRLVLQSLAAFTPDRVELPVRDVTPKVTPEVLEPLAAQVRAALSTPVTLRLGESSWQIRPRRLAEMLVLPRGGKARLGIGGKEAAAFLATLKEAVDRQPISADFVVNGDDTVSILPSESGRKLDLKAAKRAILAAAVSPDDRVANLDVQIVEPKLTGKEARAMGISTAVGRYTTTFGGTRNRQANVRLVAALVDDHLIAPGALFSFNETTGERNEAKGFKKATVIIDGERQTALGGGVCQVSTTVFNAAYEAGLPIVRRTNHALYIDHYPNGRDATVDYPNVDLQFRNDTGNWLLLRTAIGDTSLTVTLYGTPTGRTVKTEGGKILAVEKPEIVKIRDSSLSLGTEVIKEAGAPARETTVRRLVYGRNGELLFSDTFKSYYLSEEMVVRVGTALPVEEPPTVVEEPPAPAAVEDAPAADAPTPAPAEPVPAEPAPAEPAPAEPVS